MCQYGENCTFTLVCCTSFNCMFTIHVFHVHFLTIRYNLCTIFTIYELHVLTCYIHDMYMYLLMYAIMHTCSHAYLLCIFIFCVLVRLFNFYYYLLGLYWVFNVSMLAGWCCIHVQFKVVLTKDCWKITEFKGI